MQYVSTRGSAPLAPFTDILLEGLAPDGGLYVPADLPTVSPSELHAMRSMSYPQLATQVLGRFFTDLEAGALRSLVERTYTPERFASPRITPLASLEALAPGLHLLGLSQGPTLAFKDIALQLLGALFEHTLEKQGRELNILGATSGDTGSAAEHAMRGRRGIRVFMLSPRGRMSPFQAAQMYSLRDPNIFNLAVEGVFDDCQDLVKAVSADAAFKAQHAIGTVNSINWARVAAQVVYYFAGWCAAAPSVEHEVSFTVPTGNFGNAYAGWIARSMGLPVRRLVVATNENDVLHDFFRSGIYRPRPGQAVRATSSPSMDISKASNFERFAYDVVGREGSRLAELWQSLARDGALDLGGSALACRLASSGLASGRSRHADRLATIRAVWTACERLVDPHTADGIHVALPYIEPGVPMICLETALPAKFAAIVQEAVGLEPPRPSSCAGLEALPQRYDVLPTEVEVLKAYIARHTR